MKKISKKNNLRIKKFASRLRMILILFFILSLIIFQIVFSFKEGSLGIVAGEATDSITVTVSVVPSISIDSPANVNLSPDIEETGAATGSATWNVETNNSDGWQLEVAADASPAMTSGGNSFADYSETVEDTPESWSIANNVSEFGFGATGSYIKLKFGAGKYMGFNGTTKEQIASRASASGGSGDDTTVIFRAEVGSAKSQSIGDYTATITATATTL